MRAVLSVKRGSYILNCSTQHVIVLKVGQKTGLEVGLGEDGGGGRVTCVMTPESKFLLWCYVSVLFFEKGPKTILLVLYLIRFYIRCSSILHIEFERSTLFDSFDNLPLTDKIG